MPKKEARAAVLRRGVLAVTAAALALAMPVAEASAAGIFEMLFGGGFRSAPTPLPQVAPRGFTDRFGNVIESDRRESGPSAAYCVRLCDGHPFPVQSMNSSPAQACASFCPAAKTKVFTGGSIDHAVATDGKRYADLPTAFVYRKQLVADCTCNGKTPGGLARIDVKSDPTLQPGDIVATNDGLMSYREGSSGKAEFTPVNDRRLAATQIRPAPASAAALAANARAEAPPEPAARENRRRGQAR